MTPNMTSQAGPRVATRNSTGQGRQFALRTALTIVGPLLPMVIGCRMHSIPQNADPTDAQVVRALDGRYEHVHWISRVWGIDLVDATDDVLEDVLKMRHLEELGLFGATLSPKGWARLRELKDLRALSVQSSNITDQELGYLVEMESLVLVDLSYTAITDDGLMILARRNTWTKIFLEGTATTDLGIAKLRDALPACHIQK